MKMAKSVKEYIENQEKFGDSLNILREIMLSTEMMETVKWGIPTYTINSKNVLGISAFKNHFGIWFFNGVFLSDPYNILLNAQEGKTKAMRQWRFTKDSKIDKKLLLLYIKEAISNEKKGLRIKPAKKTKPLIIPKALNDLLVNNVELATAFNALSISKRRDYAEYIDTAKREETKTNRLEKILPMILKNIGLNDKYR